MKINWMRFFVNSIDAIKSDLAYVASNASGCREGWLQGELFLAAKRNGYNLRLNEHPLGGRGKADLSWGDPARMIAEIKIVGANFQAKMRHAIDADVKRLREVRTRGIERYMILIIPDSEKNGKKIGKLKNYLDSWPVDGECRTIPSKGKGFCLKILRI
jgi:hypothetical protein